MGRLEDRVALVTGGAVGLGKAIAKRLAVDGVQVVISDIDRAVGQSTAEEIGVSFFEQDVSNESQWSIVVQQIENRFGRLNVLVNNAGILGSMDSVTPEDTPLADWRRIFSVNVDGVFLGCRAVLPAMRRAGGGVIVNIASIASFLSTPYATAYGASKAAVRQLTKSIAQHCIQEKLNVRCNSVHPGNVLTPLWEKSATERARLQGISTEQFIEEAAHQMAGGFSLPEDVAATISFLVSDESSRMNGARVMVDGGALDCDTYHAYLLATGKQKSSGEAP